MKNVILILLVCVFCGCNANQEKTAEQQKQTTEENGLKTLLTQYPDSLELVQNLTGYYLQKQNNEAALQTVNTSLKRDSVNPYLWDLKSMVCAVKADTANAIAALQRAIEIYPEPDFVVSLGALYAETNNPLALEMADALLAGNKAKAEKEAYFIKGLYYSRRNEKEKAIGFFDKCIATNYTFMDAYMEKATALYALQKYDAAVAVLEKAVTLQNNYVEGYFQLGKCYEKLNRIPDAIDAYNTAYLRDPSFVEAKEALKRLRVL